MATSTAIPTKLKKSQVVNAGPQLKFDSDTLKCLLVVTGSGAPVTDSSGVEYVSDVTSSNAEVTGTGYARQTLTSVTVAYDASPSIKVDFSFANITFSQNAAGFTNARYAIVYDAQGSPADSAAPVIAVCDLGQTFGVTLGDLVLSSPSGGLIQWQ